jgi:hypothetical protein
MFMGEATRLMLDAIRFVYPVVFLSVPACSEAAKYVTPAPRMLQWSRNHWGLMRGVELGVLRNSMDMRAHSTHQAP